MTGDDSVRRNKMMSEEWPELEQGTANAILEFRDKLDTTYTQERVVKPSRALVNLALAQCESGTAMVRYHVSYKWTL